MQKPQKKKLAVYIGRFSPLHIGHTKILREISREYDHVLVLVGSSNRAPSIKNPFPGPLRGDIIRDWWKEFVEIPYGDSPVLSIDFLDDNPYNDTEWISSVQDKINQLRIAHRSWDVEIVCSSKEEQSSYPFWFPTYGVRVFEPETISGDIPLSATMLRDSYFFDNWDFFKHKCLYSVPSVTMRTLQQFKDTLVYQNLREEYAFIKSYKESWAKAPYPPIFVTTDAVVIQSGHIALIQRRDNPGKGLWALPGGFLNQDEKIEDACLRELHEETGIKVPIPVLKGSIIDRKVFDHPSRSERGRTVTHAFHIKLKDDQKLPHIKGSDDALKAKWVPLSELRDMRDQFYEDHWFIIKSFL